MGAIVLLTSDPTKLPLSSEWTVLFIIQYTLQKVLQHERSNPATTRILSSRFGHVGHSLELRMFLLTAFIVIGLSFASPYFLTYNNILNVLDQSVVVGILAVGLTLVILTAGIDLSVGSTVGLTGVAMAVSFPVLGFYPGIAIGLLTGAIVGFANGFIIEKVGSRHSS
ncbi:ABC transporter permease [Ochrobactrum pseudogrignonense]|nr:ABC transporter permease [Brucella pseudogrignonensis]